jgi:putative Mn2+ efflux pump MntP
MGIIELFLIGVGLSMDAFAVAVCKGLNMCKINYKHSLIIGLFFGGFQGLMPFIGWFIGSRFEQYIVKFDHWIAFGLLGFIGGKMLYDAITEKEEECCKIEDKFDYKELLIMAVATSIDALAVGITFAFLGMNILQITGAVSLIGITTFVLAFIGVVIGNKFGSVYKRKAEIAGGVVLVLIGLKILLEHLGVINF